MSAPPAHPRVTFGQVTVFVVELERRPSPPPVLIKVPNPYLRHAVLPFTALLEPPTNLNDAVAMMLQWTRDMANRSPDLFIPPPKPDDDW